MGEEASPLGFAFSSSSSSSWCSSATSRAVKLTTVLAVVTMAIPIQIIEIVLIIIVIVVVAETTLLVQRLPALLLPLSKTPSMLCNGKQTDWRRTSPTYR